MSVASVDRIFPVRLLGTLTLGAVLILVAGLAEAVSPLAAAAIAAGGGAVVPTAALVSRGVSYYRSYYRAARLNRPMLAACHCAGMLALGVFVGGLTAVVLPLAGDAYRPAVATGGLVASAVLFTIGLLHVPGLASTRLARLRHGLDGLVIGTTLAMVGWLVMPGVGANHPLAYVAAVIAATHATIGAAVALRTTHRRSLATRCGTGTGLATFGLALLVVSVGRDAPHWGLLVAAGMIVVGPPLIWTGARRVDLTIRTDLPASLDEAFGGYPMLALPVGGAALAVAYHLVVAGMPDVTAVLLGIGVGAALAAREILAAADMRRVARRLAVHEARLLALVSGTSDVTVVLGDDLVVRWLSPAASHQFGLADRDLVGRPLTERIHPNDAAAFVDLLRVVTSTGGSGVARHDGPVLVEARMLDGAGRWRETESTVSDLRTAPEVGALVVQVRDVGQRRDLERAVRRLTSTDRRTGLPNRRELLRAIAARRGAGHQAGALIVIELYGLAAVNDLEGRATGDAVLVQAARRVRDQVGADDLPSRLGGSQFAAVTAVGPIEAYALAVRLLTALTAPYPLAGRPPVHLQTSVGLAGLAGGGSADEVLRRGGLALRQASQLGRNRIEWYDESFEEQLVRRLDLERHLPGATGRDELDLVYQPVVQLAGGRPVGVAALLRWRHPMLGTVPPDELLPVADKLRVSSEIAEWLLHTACRQVGAWRRDGHDLWLAVAVSAHQLVDPDFVPEVAAALSVHQTPPERLVVEISNREISERGECAPAAAESTGNLPMVAAQLSKLRALGVRTALAGFGTGHTDLARLRRLPLDLVKLAASSIGDASAGASRGEAGGEARGASGGSGGSGGGSGGSGGASGGSGGASGGSGGASGGELAAAAVHLTRRLGLAVIADGLESEAQRAQVRRAGCRYGQGRVVAPPAPAERIEAYLESQRAPSR